MINFPGIGLSLNINRIAFSILGIDIYWYGIIIGLALLVCAILAYKNAGRYNIPMEKLDEFLLWVIPLSVVGARLYYVIFNFDYYFTEPSKIFNLRDGGIAIYGAILTAVIVTYVFCKKRKIDFKVFVDFLIPYLALGQAIGRWGNFFNKEAYGVITNLPWRMEIWSDYYKAVVSVHPTFLYESIWNLCLFIILLKTNKNPNHTPGTTGLAYFIGYGIGRFWIEGLRIDSLMWNNMRVSQILSLILVLICTFLVIYVKKRKNKEK